MLGSIEAKEEDDLKKLRRLRRNSLRKTKRNMAMSNKPAVPALQVLLLPVLMLLVVMSPQL